MAINASMGRVWEVGGKSKPVAKPSFWRKFVEKFSAWVWRCKNAARWNAAAMEDGQDEYPEEPAKCKKKGRQCE